MDQPRAKTVLQLKNLVREIKRKLKKIKNKSNKKRKKIYLKFSKSQVFIVIKKYRSKRNVSPDIIKQDGINALILFHRFI
jgi:hypothetical protein